MYQLHTMYVVRTLESYAGDTAAGGEGVVITNGDGKYEPGKRPSKTTLKIKKELKQTIDLFLHREERFLLQKNIQVKKSQLGNSGKAKSQGEKLQGNYYKEYAAGAPIVPITKRSLPWMGR